MSTEPLQSEAAPPPSRTEITFVPSNVWRTGLVVIGLVALGLMLRFVIADGGTVIFTVLMSWFAALAMAPIVNRLSRRMRRGVATMIVMLSFAALVVVFVVAFGSLMVDQLVQLVSRIPVLIDDAFAFANERLGLNLTLEDALASLGGIDFGSVASQLGANLFSLVGSVFGTVFGLFTFGLFTFYLSAQAPQLERWITSLFPSRAQGVVGNVLRISAQKTGGYVGARVILAAVNATASAVVFALAGMPYWLPLALWTGIVAQFVPTIGTYIAIVLPALVGALSPNPWLGLVALGWGLLYQQIENLTIEPRISARAVDVNPAVAFGSVLLGSALFGVAGAFLAVPVTAMLMAVLETYVKRYDLADELAALDDVDSPPAVAAQEGAAPA